MDPPPPSVSPGDLFEAALDLPVKEREAFLVSVCGGNAALLAEVRALLAALEAMPTGFLASPVDGKVPAWHFDATIDARDSNRASDKAAGPVAGNNIDPTPLASSEGSGDLIELYKLREQIGEGGFGTVWVADQDKPVKRRVALKIVKLGMDTKEVIARFEQERQALAMMDHPNIARVFDAGSTESGRPYFVMELVRGMKITDYCDEKELTTQERLELFISVCQAVQHAHQKGIIHRDIKPSNILVTMHDGKPLVKVIDFGVAKATQGRLSEQTIYTQFQQMIGTPLYMSPEQADMTSQDVDTRSDIYSLGVLLYELLTGGTPIDAATMRQAGLDEMRRIIREVDPPRPSMRLKTLDGSMLTTTAKRRHTDAAKLPSTLRGDLDWIVMKCIEKDRTRRYDTANGLAMDLQRHLNNEVITARPPTAAYLMGKLFRRNKLAFAAGAAIAASLVIGLAASLWQAVRAKSAEQQAVAAFDELRATAPAFADQARSLAAKEQYDEAIAKLAYAITLRPEAAEFLVQKADLLQCQLKLAEAATIYRAALALQPDHTRAEASAKLCDELLAAPLGPDGKLTRDSLGKLHLAMQKQQRPAAELLPVARLLGAEEEHLVASWLDRLKDLPISPEKPLRDRLTVREDGLLELDLKDTQITDLAVLAGMPLGKLTLWNCRQIADFSLLREFRSLTYLDLDGTQIVDLSVLSSLPLELLSIGGTAVSDLSPLRGMKLKTLGLYRCRNVSDLSPLEGLPLTELFAVALAHGVDFSPLKSLPLEKCAVGSPSVTDLSFLAACPLKELGLLMCESLRGLGWLTEIKSLERLIIPWNYHNLPDDDLQAIAALRSHPRLAFLQDATGSNPTETWRRFQVTQSKEIFWRDWDREQTFLPAIRAAGFRFSLTKLPGDTYLLRIEEQPLRDLSFLKGAPISGLWIGGTEVTDLSPIADLPLRSLGFWSTAVTDIGPLRKMRLEELSLGTGAVTDLSPLADMPLQKLYMHQCKAVGDLSPILNLQTLQSLTVPVTARNIESLRGLKNLRWLGFRGDGYVTANSTPVDLFWERWPGMAWSRTLNESGMDYTATEGDDGLWSVTVKSNEFRDCGIFKGAAIRALTLSNTTVADLRPLADIPLTKLDLRRTFVTDLSPLRATTLGKSLNSLNLRQSSVSDFAPLEDCVNLKFLDASDTVLSDVSFLRGRNLERLEIQNTKVADIWALAEMPLTVLRLEGTRVTDLSPLRRCVKLQSLVLPGNALDLAALEEIPGLIALSYKASSAGSPEQKAVDFWKEYDEVGWLRALRESGISPNVLKRLENGTWEVNLDKTPIRDLAALQGATNISRLTIQDTRVTDLSPLRGMALRHLALAGIAVRDLGPLQGMPLEFLSCTGTPVADLSPLQGMPLQILYLSETPVADLSALHGMPLSELWLRDCPQLTDLSPLADCRTLTALALPPAPEHIEFLRDPAKFPNLRRIGYFESTRHRLPENSAPQFWRDYDAEKKLSAIPGIAGRFKNLGPGEWELGLEKTGFSNLALLKDLPITSLNLGATDVSDLTPLRDLPLKKLTLFDTKVTDLIPLKGMPLEELNLRGTPLTDLSPLRGMPLTSLRLQGSAVTDLSPIADCKTLVTLVLPTSAIDIEFLRSFPNLERLSYEALVDGLPRQSGDEFWKEFDGLAWLRASGLSQARAKMLPDGSLDLDFHGVNLSDIALLQGQRIRRLGIGNTSVTDLGPLRGMPLVHLNLYNTRVTDLSPLAGMPLANLSISGTGVTDISVLRGMPLKGIRMHHCKQLTDLSPLAGLKDIAQLTLPPNAKDIEFLRDPGKFPKLKRLSFIEDQTTRQPDKTAGEFWKEYDAKKKP